MLNCKSQRMNGNQPFLNLKLSDFIAIYCLYVRVCDSMGWIVRYRVVHSIEPSIPRKTQFENLRIQIWYTCELYGHISTLLKYIGNVFGTSRKPIMPFDHPKCMRSFILHFLCSKLFSMNVASFFSKFHNSHTAWNSQYDLMFYSISFPSIREIYGIGNSVI